MPLAERVRESLAGNVEEAAKLADAYEESYACERVTV
jgi:hypothetical protein